MLKDEIWLQVAQKDGESWTGGGYLCKDCIEKCLGRALKYEDLMTFDDGSPVFFNKEFIKKYFPEHSED